MRPIATSLLAAALGLSLACNHKSEAAVQAEEAAKAAEARVAQLEQQLADAKSGKVSGEDAETVKQVTTSQVKALERQVADAKKRVVVRKQEAEAIAKAPEAPKPVVVEVPTGTKLEISLARELSTEKDQAGDAWEGTLAADVVQDGKLVWSAGTAVRGVVTQSAPAGRLSNGQGALGIRLTEVAGIGIDADTHVVVATAKGERNAKYIGGGAALGALIGILSDKKNKNDHALGGAALGAAAGTAIAAGTADTIIRIPAAKPIAFSLTAPEKVTLRK